MAASGNNYHPNICRTKGVNKYIGIIKLKSLEEELCGDKPQTYLIPESLREKG